MNGRVSLLSYKDASGMDKVIPHKLRDMTLLVPHANDIGPLLKIRLLNLYMPCSNVTFEIVLSVALFETNADSNRQSLVQGSCKAEKYS